MYIHMHTRAHTYIYIHTYTTHIPTPYTYTQTHSRNLTVNTRLSDLAFISVDYILLYSFKWFTRLSVTLLLLWDNGFTL